MCDEKNFTNITDCESGSDYKSVVSVVVPILFGLIVVVGLFGNALVVLVVAFNQQMRNTTNLLIINLAIADLLFIVICVPFTATDYALRYWPYGDLWCKSVQYIVIVTAYVSIYTLVLMSLDRFLAVVFPISSMAIRNERNTSLLILCTWVVIVTACVPAIFAHGEYTYLLRVPVTVCKFLDSSWNYPAFQLSFFATAYVVPLVIICGLYVVMLNRLWGTGPEGHMSRESLRGKKRVTRMVVVVVVIFAVCWCPIHIVLVLRSLNRYDQTSLTVMIQIVSHVLAYMNSCVNPILYAFLSENFRKAFRRIIYCNGNNRYRGGRDLPNHKQGTQLLETKAHFQGRQNKDNNGNQDVDNV